MPFQIVKQNVPSLDVWDLFEFSLHNLFLEVISLVSALLSKIHYLCPNTFN